MRRDDYMPLEEFCVFTCSWLAFRAGFYDARQCCVKGRSPYLKTYVAHLLAIRIICGVDRPSKNIWLSAFLSCNRVIYEGLPGASS